MFYNTQIFEDRNGNFTTQFLYRNWSANIMLKSIGDAGVGTRTHYLDERKENHLNFLKEICLIFTKKLPTKSSPQKLS